MKENELVTESQEENSTKKVFTLDQVKRGDWVIIKNEKNNALKQGFVTKIHGENEQLKQIRVELLDNSVGFIYDIPDRNQITEDVFVFYKNLMENRTALTPFHFKSQEFLINQWTTFRSQPRETVVEFVMFFATVRDPRHPILDAEYKWEPIELNEEFIQKLKNAQISCVVIDGKYKISLDCFELIYRSFRRD